MNQIFVSSATPQNTLRTSEKELSGFDQAPQQMMEAGGESSAEVKEFMDNTNACVDKKSMPIALVIEVFLTPISERWYLGYRTGPNFALALVILFLLFFACMRNETSSSLFVKVGGWLSKAEGDQEKAGEKLKMFGFSVTIAGVLFAICFVMWAVIDFALIITGRMKDADGCPLG